MVYANVYHGDEQLCQEGKTRPIQLQQESSSSPIWNWNEIIEFNIDVKDLPRGARLCMAIYAVYGKTKSKKKGSKEVGIVIFAASIAWMYRYLASHQCMIIDHNCRRKCPWRG